MKIKIKKIEEWTFQEGSEVTCPVELYEVMKEVKKKKGKEKKRKKER